MSNAEIYANGLWHTKQGYALWFPEPGDCRKVSVGDVGFLNEKDGDFSRLFNITLDNNQATSRDFGVPANCQPFLGVAEAEPVLSYHQKHDTFHSNSVTKTVIDVSQENSAPDSSITFTPDKREGAALVFVTDADRHKCLSMESFRKYAKHHRSHWLTLFNETLKYGLKEDDIMLVTGCDMAASWAVAACRGPKTLPEAHVCVELMWRRRNWISLNRWEWRFGPERPKDAWATVSTVPRNPGDKDQCVFLRGLRFSSRLKKKYTPSWELVELKPADEYSDDLDQVSNPDDSLGSTDDESDSGSSVENYVFTEEFTIRQPTDVMLKYIFKNSNATVGMVDDDWWCALDQDFETLDDLSVLLEVLAPEVLVDEDGVGWLRDIDPVHNVDAAKV